MKFDTQHCWSNCLHDLSWYIHNHDYTNLTQYELLLSSSIILSKNNKQFWKALLFQNNKNFWKLKLNMKKHKNMLFKNNKHVSFKICQIWAELFYMLAWKWNHKIFAIIMKDIEKVLESKSYTNSWSFIFEKYHDLINVFERQNVNKLLSHWEEYNIEIELKLEKISNFEFLYNILWKKLQILQ